jgi:PilZ domain-containing protein
MVRDYCRERFIQTCYEHLEECEDKFKERDQADDLACRTCRRSLQEIVGQSTVTSLTAGDLSNLERIQLLDIVRWAGNLIRQIRRGPRKQVSIPVRLYLESSSQTCAEETLVREVSQHGTALTCRLPINVGEMVRVERMDTGERVEGIVRWRERRDGTSPAVGIEFTRCNNFWRL